MFPKKGERGYIRGKKIKYLLLALLLAILILAFFLTGFFITGDTKNIFSILAVLTALPFANMITVYAAIFPYQAPCQEEYDKVAEAAGEGLFCTELVVTCGNMKNIYLPYVYVEKDMVLAYSPTKNIRSEKYEEYLSGMLGANRLQLKVKVFTQLTPFIRRLKDMEHIPENQADEKHLEAAAVMKGLAI